MSAPTITVTGTYHNAAGQPRSGHVTFTLNVELRDPVGNVIATRDPIRSVLNDDGEMTGIDGETVGLVLYCTEGGDIQPTSGVVYKVVERVGARTVETFVSLPSSLGAEVDMADLIPVEESDIVWTVPDLTEEQARDLVGTTLVAGAGLSKAIDDEANTVTLTAEVTQLELTAEATARADADSDLAADVLAEAAARASAIAALNGTYVPQDLSTLTSSSAPDTDDVIPVHVDGALRKVTISDILALASGGGLTQEQAEDIVAALIDDNSDLDWTYDDNLASLVAVIKTGSVTNAMLAGSIALSKLATDPLARANHTGSQAASTISDFATAADARIAAVVVKAFVDALNVDAATLDGETVASLTTAITAAIVDSAPGTLDTLNELAAALGDDPNFASTITTALAGKQPLDADLTALAAAGNSAVLAATTASFTTADETKLDGIETGATADQSAAEILAALLTVDGSGSGLDADTVRGTTPTAFGLSLVDDANAAAGRTTLGLGNVDNTSDANKPVSTAQQSALDLKAPLASPTFTGTPAAPTAAQGTNTTQLATTAYVQTEAGLLVPKSLVDAKGDIIVGTSADTVARKAVGSNGQALIADSAQSDGLKWVSLDRVIRVVLDGGGSAITTGAKKVYVTVPFDCTITKARLLADVSGSIVIDVWKDTYANFPPTVADTITASAKPTLSSAQKSEDSTLTGWTTSLSAGDILEVNVDSAATVTKVMLDLFVRPR